MFIAGSTLYEVICINLRLPSGHRFLVCGMCYPPRHNYAEEDLMSSRTNIVDNELDEHPQTVVVCGGDLNKLNIDRLEKLTGWNAMVDFQTRCLSCLDNCLSNLKEFFWEILSLPNADKNRSLSCDFTSWQKALSQPT